MNLVSKHALWALMTVVGVFSLGTVALSRGETLNALWIITAAVSIYLVAYRYYSLYIADKVMQLDPTRATPAVRHNDGLDFVPTNKYILFGHHFAAIAGAFLWYTAERAYYVPVAFQPGAEIRLVPLTSDQPEAIVVAGVEGIDADSSPIKFRACFTTPLTLATLTETYRDYPGAEPLARNTSARFITSRTGRPHFFDSSTATGSR